MSPLTLSARRTSDWQMAAARRAINASLNLPLGLRLVKKNGSL
jgi:hypothetical protein